jgi:frataxin-like iron-binding protein CyaY
MWRNYSPKTFLRLTPNAILKEYFSRKNLLTDIDFDSLGETEIETVSEALDELPEQQKREIEANFRQVNEMACEAGVHVLVEEAAYPYHNIDLATTFEGMKNHYERVFWVFLNHPEVFEIASELAYMERVGGWKHKYVGGGLQPAVEQKDLENLAKSLSEFYKKQDRGHHCKIENYRREQPERHCYFAYPEDYATTDMGYDEEGKFKHWPKRPAFEVIFVYRPESGFLEVSAKGKSDEIEALQEIFCQTILGLEGLPDEKGKHYDLSKLKEKNFPFVRDPQDGIDNVVIKMLRLDLPGFGNRRITFEASSRSGEQPVHTLIEQALNKAKISLDKTIAAKAKLQFKFAPRERKKGKTLTFEISIPDRCTLRDDPLDQIAKKYIERWGFVGG